MSERASFSMIDLDRSSIDTVIQWLRSQRRMRPAAPLSELASLSKLSADRLTDLACIDLIERRRLGQTTQVEDVLREIPELATSDPARLDLIDAELCVLREIGHRVELADYAKRFPDLAQSIEALAKLDAVQPIPQPSWYPADEQSLSRPSARSIDADQSPETGHPIELSHLVQPPSWFTREDLHSCSERSYLIRGRDSHANRAVALKVIRLSASTTQRDIELYLAAIEAASMVRHPAWVAPEVAAVERQSLAVIRPWIFGDRWDQSRRLAAPQVRLRDLATIGYSLQSAHDTHATDASHSCAAHGGIHLNNLYVDADGRVRILDAIACIQPPSGEGLGSPSLARTSREPTSQRRRHCDVRSLCALVHLETAALLAADRGLRKQISMLDRFCESLIADPNQPTACARLADTMMKLSDENFSDPAAGDSLIPSKPRWKRLFHRRRTPRDAP